MNSNTFSKFNETELYCYEIMGVKLFKKAILSFEKIKHHKSGKHNENYHLKNISASSAESFSGYLIYNATFHIISILLAVIYFAAAVPFHRNIFWIDILMCIATVFNLYCIMLQRYIYLKIKAGTTKLNARQNKKIREHLNKAIRVLNERDDAELEEEFRLLKKILNCQRSGKECFIEADCAVVLDRLACVAAIAQSTVHQPRTKNEAEAFLNQTLTQVNDKTFLQSLLEKKVSKIQKLLRVEETRNVTFGFCIITENSLCENAFCRLFPDPTRTKFEFIVSFLLAAYEQKGLVIE